MPVQFYKVNRLFDIWQYLIEDTGSDLGKTKSNCHTLLLFFYPADF